ncbi:MAG: M28 family metallopeptidase [Haloarculaceae archaeon]
MDDAEAPDDPTRTDADDRLDLSDATVAALGRAWLSARPWTLLTRLAELDNRMGGHPGDRRAADLVAEAFAGAGVTNVERQPFDTARWTRGETDLAVRVPDRDVERAFEAVALPYSPAFEGAAPLVDVGHATPGELDAADVAGAVVLAETATPPEFDRPYHRVEKAGRAAAAGAEAFVFVNHVPGQLPPTGSLRFDAEAPIPGVGVSAETGAWLREYAGEGARARLRVDARTEPATSHNVVGTLGPDTDAEVVVLAHFDAHDVGEGALDNGCGVATLVGALPVLRAMDLDRRVRVAGVSCEETGLVGSAALADSLDLADVHAVVNLDGVGRYRDLRALVHTADAVGEVVERVDAAVDHAVAVSDQPHPYSDHWPFLRRGVPTLQLHSENPDSEGTWDRGWGHTRADTRDKADSRTIREHAMLAALLIGELASDDLARLDPGDVRERLVDDGARAGMQAADIWPAEWDGGT